MISKEDILQNEILNGSLFKALLKLSIPIIITSLLDYLYYTADVYWVSHWSKGGEGVAAIQISWSLIYIILSLNYGFNVAATSMISQYSGAKKKNILSFSAGQILSISIISTTILAFLGIFISIITVNFMNVDFKTKSYFIMYTFVNFLGYPLTQITSTFMTVLASRGNSKTPAIVISIGTIINIILDPFLIYGWFIFPQLGVLGAGIATVFSQSISSIIALYLLHYGISGIKIRKNHLKPHLKTVKKIFKIALPSASGSISLSVGFFLFIFIVTQLPDSTTILAAYGIGDRFRDINIIICGGITMALATVAGQNIGAEKHERIKKAFLIAVTIMTSILLVSSIIIYIFRYYLVYFFTDNMSIVNETVNFLTIYIIFAPLYGITEGVEALFEGSGNTKPILVKDILISLLSVFLVYILSVVLKMGGFGVWLTIGFAIVISLFISLVLYFTQNWKTKVIEDT